MDLPVSFRCLELLLNIYHNAEEQAEDEDVHEEVLICQRRGWIAFGMSSWLLTDEGDKLLTMISKLMNPSISLRKIKHAVINLEA